MHLFMKWMFIICYEIFNKFKNTLGVVVYLIIYNYLVLHRAIILFEKKEIHDDRNGTKLIFEVFHEHNSRKGKLPHLFFFVFFSVYNHSHCVKLRLQCLVILIRLNTKYYFHYMQIWCLCTVKMTNTNHCTFYFQVPWHILNTQYQIKMFLKILWFVNKS